MKTKNLTMLLLALHIFITGRIIILIFINLFLSEIPEINLINQSFYR